MLKGWVHLGRYNISNLYASNHTASKIYKKQKWTERRNRQVTIIVMNKMDPSDKSSRQKISKEVNIDIYLTPNPKM